MLGQHPLAPALRATAIAAMLIAAALAGVATCARAATLSARRSS